MKFLLDTNFLLIPGKFKVDVFSELNKFGKPELFTLDFVLKELEIIAKRKDKSAGHAKIGFDLIKNKKIKILKSKGKSTDKEIIRLAQQGFAVCTQDKGIIKALKGKTEIITLRQKKYLIKI